jgi:hypothetical protein
VASRTLEPVIEEGSRVVCFGPPSGAVQLIEEDRGTQPFYTVASVTGNIHLPCYAICFELLAVIALVYMYRCLTN